MEGRWEITQNWSTGGNIAIGPGIGRRDRVPVVPCDDAAIERAYRALASCGEGFHGMDWDDIAKVVFRAAREAS